MTHRAELLDLQQKARNAGRTCNFYYTEQGYIDGVAYMDPQASPLSRLSGGMILDPLTFAEKERAALSFAQQTDPARLSRERMGLHRKPRRFVS
jgi:hypothetical protein